jgi:predicted porin
MKKLLPAAVLLAAFGSAHADATVYGLVDLSYSKSIGDDITKKKADFHSGGDCDVNGCSDEGNSATRIGVKGSADVGKGIKANYKFETGGITSDGEVNPGSTKFFNRAAWAGLSGGFGEVRLGRQDSVPFQTMIDFDFNGAANIASAYGSSGVAAWGTGRQSRSLQYISNEMGGLKVQAGFVPEGNVVGDKANFSLGATYTLNKLVVAATAESKRTTTGKNFSAIAARYDLGVVKVAATYANGGTKDNKGLGLGVTATVGDGINVGAQFGHNSNKATGIELFANKEVLKNIYAYLDVGNLEVKSTTPTVKGTGFALGAIYVF